MRSVILFLVGFWWMVQAAGAADETIAVIGHPGVPRTDQASLLRLYTGRVVSLGTQSAVPVNLAPGDPVRTRFLEVVLGQSEEQYTGYWLVRRYVGKGAPPLEFETVDALLRHVLATPGAVGYVPMSRVPAGANVIFRR
jgi:hypothetical protein